MKYHPEITLVLTGRAARDGTVLIGQFDWGGLLPKVTEECNGTLGPVGNRATRAQT